MPHVFNNKVQLADGQNFSLKFNNIDNSKLDNSKCISGEFGMNTYVFYKNLFANTNNYYIDLSKINESFNDSNTSKNIGLAIFDQIVSDTILCVKTSPNIQIKYEQVQRRDPKIDIYDNFWCFAPVFDQDDQEYIINYTNTFTNTLFYRTTKYKNIEFTLKDTIYQPFNDISIAYLCEISPFYSVNKTPNAYYTSGSNIKNESLGLLVKNGKTYDFMQQYSIYSPAIDAVTNKPSVFIDINYAEDTVLDNPNKKLTSFYLYNYYWKQAQNIPLLSGTGLYYLFNCTIDNTNVLVSANLEQPENLSGQWYYHFGLCKYNIGKKLLNTMVNVTTINNNTQTIFVSPVQQRFTQTYKMNSITSGDVLGFADNHALIANSIGLSWPLFNSTNLSGYILNNDNICLNTYNDLEYLPYSLNRYTFNKIYFKQDQSNENNVLSSVLPSANIQLCNIKLITNDINEVLNSGFQITYNNGAVTKIVGKDLYDNISFPSIISNTFNLDEANSLTQALDNRECISAETSITGSFDNNYQNIYVFNINNLINVISDNNTLSSDINIKSIKLINQTTIKLNSESYLIGEILNNNILTEEILLSGIVPDSINNSIQIIRDKLTKFKNKFFILVNDNTLSTNTLYKYTELLNTNCTIYNTPQSQSNFDIDISNNSINYENTYLFKNLADLLLFYIYSKSYINFFMIKFNKLFNHISNYTNTGRTDIYNNTFLSSKKDLFVNAYTMYTLASYSNLNDPIIWKAFPYHNTEIDSEKMFQEQFTTIKKQSNNGTMYWAQSKNHSKIIGVDYPKRKVSDNNSYNEKYFKNFKNFVNTFNESNEDKYLLTQADKNYAKNYTCAMQKTLSLYRPFYIQFKNMFNILDWSINALTNIQTINDFADPTYKLPSSMNQIQGQFEAGFIRLNQIVYNKSNSNNAFSQQQCICINYNAYNKEFGWFYDNFSFDSIIDPNLDNLQTITLKNTKYQIASTLSAGLLQPSLTIFELLNLNKLLCTSFLTLNLSNINISLPYTLHKNSITVLSGHTYNIINNLTGYVSYILNSSQKIQYIPGNSNINLSGPSATISGNDNYNTHKIYNIQYSFYDKLQFNTIPEQVDGIYLAAIITDISNNSVFAPTLNLNNVKNIQLSKFLINAKAAFKDNSSLMQISNTMKIPDTCVDTSQMFMNCTSLENINEFEYGSSVSSTAYMFYNCVNLMYGIYNYDAVYNYSNIDQNLSLDFSLNDQYDFDNLPPVSADLYGQFYKQYIIPSSIVDCSYMYANCVHLLPPFSIEIGINVKNAAGLFMNCNSITDLTENIVFKTNTLTNCSYMFYGIRDTEIPHILSSIPNSVTDLSYIFADWIYNNEIPYYIRLTDNCTNADGMFKDNYIASAIITSNILQKFTTFQILPGVKSTNEMFSGCKNLYFDKNKIKWDTIISQVSSCNDMFRDCLLLDHIIPDCLPPGTVSCSGMFWNCEKITNIPNTFKLYDNIKNTNSMFKNCDSISGIPCWFTNKSKVKNVGSMFEGMLNIDSFPASYVLPKTVTNAEDMFKNCTNLVNLDLNKFLSAIIDREINISGMFMNCSLLTGTVNNDILSVLLSPQFTNKDYSRGIFAGCINLTNYIQMPEYLTTIG